MGLKVGDTLPLYCQLADYDPTRFVQAVVVDPTGNPISGSPFNLTSYNSSGGYRNLTGVMPNQDWLHATYLVYDDSGHTELSGSSGGSDQLFFLDNIDVLPQTSNIVAFADVDQCNAGPVEDTIIQGSSRILLIRLAAGVNGDPVDLTGASAIVFRIRNEDGTVLVISLTDTLQIVNAGGGQISVTLSAAQTALLAPALPAPASIIFTIAGKPVVVNMPTQLAVEEASV